MAKTLSVDENTQPLQGSIHQELDALNVASVHCDQNIRLENVNLNQVKVQQDQALLGEDISCVKNPEDSLPPSKECTLCEIDTSHKLHQTENLSTERLGVPVQEFREASAVNEHIINKNLLEVPEREKKESVILVIDQGQYIVPQGKGNDIEKMMMEQKQEISTQSLIDLKRINGQQSNQKLAEMQCSSQQKSNKVNQVSKVKEQAKQMENQQVKKQKTGMVGDNHERINYLVQLSRTLVNMGQSEDDPTGLNFDKPLASQTGSLSTAVGRKSLIRLSPSLKRVLCKGCGTMLIYGVNARVRQRSNRQRHLVITCLVCNTIRRLVCDAGHKLWCEQEEAVV